jgi:hypothetical protein
LQQIAIERRAKVEEFQCKHRVGREQGSCLYNQQRLKCMIKVAEVKSRAVTISVSLLVGDKVCTAKLSSANGPKCARPFFFNVSEIPSAATLAS